MRLCLCVYVRVDHGSLRGRDKVTSSSRGGSWGGGGSGGREKGRKGGDKEKVIE